MTQMLTTLFSGSLLVVLLCQAVVRRLHFDASFPTADLLFTLGLFFCAASILTTWLGTGSEDEAEEEPTDPRKKSQKKGPHDTIL